AVLVALALAALPGCGRTTTGRIDPGDPRTAAPNGAPPPGHDLNAEDEKARQAADKSGQLGDTAVAQRFARRVSDDDFARPEEKLAALNALKALAPELIDEALWNALRSRNPRVRSWALEEMKRRDADDYLDETLVRALQDDNPDVRREAAEALH